MTSALSRVDPSLQTLEAGELRAVYLPGRGMLGVSRQHRGEELLGLVQNVSELAEHGDPCGIPLLHPWANRLSGDCYRAAGNEVMLGDGSPLLFRDGAGLPMHGVPWSRLPWTTVSADTGHLVALLDWDRTEWLAVYPYRHRLVMSVALTPSALTVETTLSATGSDTVPVAFGFHPYLQMPGVRRAELDVSVPTMSHLVLGSHQIPTGETIPFPGIEGELGSRTFDDGFALPSARTTFSIAGAGRRVLVEFIEGYTHGQIYAPPRQEYLAIEPMTAPANALVSGDALRLVSPGETFSATFRIGVEAMTLPTE